jgi:putative hydrolase of the HAD superfamily
LNGDQERAHRLHKQISTSALWLDYNHGIYNSEAANAAMLEMLAPEDREVGRQYLDHWHEIYEVINGIPERIGDLQSRGIKLYILSVHTERFEDIYKRYDLLQQFDGRLISYEVGMDKRRPEFFEALLKKYDLKAEDCMYFDDHARCAAVSRTLGINGHQFIGAAAARKILGLTNLS